MAKAPLTCPMCGKVLPRLRRLFCSDKCGNRYRQVKKYGLTAEDYAALIKGGKCPICGRRVRRWNVDHDHTTGKVRGVVCGTCNQRVLTAINTPQQAFRLLEYLSLPPASALAGDTRTVTEIIAKKKRYWR